MKLEGNLNIILKIGFYLAENVARFYYKYSWLMLFVLKIVRNKNVFLYEKCKM
jgi:hypothetical protein